MFKFPQSNQKPLLLFKGGSHCYGLNTSTSDIDNRGVFVHTDIPHLVGLSKEEIIVCQNGEDNVFTEFRHALRLLRAANTQVIEMLFIKPEACDFVSDFWKRVQSWRHALIGDEKLFNAIRGYMQSEQRLANGERTGKLGGKRKSAIDKYGFSPKNFVQLFRLAFCGETYFSQKDFPVNLKLDAPNSFYKFLMRIKTSPEEFTKEGLNEMVIEASERLVQAFENAKKEGSLREFKEDVANNLCAEVYKPLVADLTFYQL